jgi:hypothetical protein
MSKKDWYLGKTKEEHPLYIYLEDFEWSCGWFWSGGYLEGYTTKRKNYHRGHQMHTHFDGCFLNTVDQRGHSLGSFYTPWMEVPDYVKNPVIVRNGASVWENLSFFLDDAQYGEDAWWRIKDLFKQFYALKAAAEVYRHGGHCTSNGRTDAEIVPQMEHAINAHIEDVIIPELQHILDTRSKSYYEQERKMLVENAIKDQR